MNCIYIPRCADGSLYRGWTDCLGKRIETHNLRKDAKYAKGHCPVTLAYYEEFITKEGAAEQEATIKRLSRQGKLKLIG